METTIAAHFSIWSDVLFIASWLIRPSSVSERPSDHVCMYILTMYFAAKMFRVRNQLDKGRNYTRWEVSFLN